MDGLKVNKNTKTISTDANNVFNVNFEHIHNNMQQGFISTHQPHLLGRLLEHINFNWLKQSKANFSLTSQKSSRKAKAMN